MGGVTPHFGRRPFDFYILLSGGDRLGHGPLEKAILFVKTRQGMEGEPSSYCKTQYFFSLSKRRRGRGEEIVCMYQYCQGFTHQDQDQ